MTERPMKGAPPSASPVCPVCGFDGSGLSPHDAAAALRSFPRRFVALVDAEPDAESDAAPSPSPDVRAGVAREAIAAARAITSTGEALRRVLITDHPQVSVETLPSSEALPAAPEGSSVEGSSVEEATALLAAAVGPVADLAATTSGAAWDRTGSRVGPVGSQATEVRAIDLLREAAHAGAHHLRAAAQLPGVSRD